MICYCFELKSCSQLTTQGFANALNVVAAVFSGSSQVLAVGIFHGIRVQHGFDGTVIG